MQLSEDKNSLRITLLARRQRVDPVDAIAAGQVVADYVSQVVPAGTVVAGYSVVRGEMEILFAMKKLATQGCQLCLPVIEDADKPLFFRKWAPGVALIEGRYGITIPDIDQPIVRPDIVLVPLVAFDRGGNRLGYGAGYYDRTIEKLRSSNPQLVAIGVGYSFQQVEMMAVEPHDQKLDMVITEKGIMKV